MIELEKVKEEKRQMFFQQEALKQAMIRELDELMIPETNSVWTPPKMDGWKMMFLIWDVIFVRCLCYVENLG